MRHLKLIGRKALKRCGRIESRPAGVTLIEVLAAVAIFGIGCMAVMSMQIMSMNSGQRATNLTIASFLAESQMEWLRSLAFNAVQAVSQNPERLARDGEACPASAPDNTCFTRTTTINLGTPTSRSYQIWVEVKWKGLDGERKVIYDTVISAPGL